MQQFKSSYQLLIHLIISSAIYLASRLVGFSCVMWFSTKSHNSVVQPQVLINGTPLFQVDKQKYLGVTFHSKLTWCSHVAAVCKSTDYYLYVTTVNHCHVKSWKCWWNLLFVSIYLCSPSLGASNIAQDSSCGLCKLEHVYIIITKLLVGFLHPLLIQYCTLCAMLD